MREQYLHYRAHLFVWNDSIFHGGYTTMQSNHQTSWLPWDVNHAIKDPSLCILPVFYETGLFASKTQIKETGLLWCFNAKCPCIYIHCSIGWFYEWISHRICKEKLGRKHCGALLSFRPWHLLNKPVVNHVDLGQNTSLAVSPYVPLSKVFTLKVCLRVCRPHSSCVHQPITKYKKKEVKRREGSSICDTKSTTEKNECVIVEYSLRPDSSVTVAVGHKTIENSL